MLNTCNPIDSRVCDGVSRPELLRTRPEAAAARQQAKDTSVIWLWLSGGLTHVETFDPKVTAPAEYRSVAGEVATPLAGVTVGGTFPKIASVADKMALVRSLPHANNGHGGGTHYVMTGYDNRNVDNGGLPTRPGIGSILFRVRHWAPLSTLALAGGGVKMGQVVGASAKVDVPKTTPIADGEATITAATSDGKTATLACRVDRHAEPMSINFANEITPIFTKLGCNADGCHGKSGGQNGFKMSLLGFYPSEDYEWLVKEHRGRRLDEGSYEWELLTRWIEQGMPYGSEGDAVVQSIEASPHERTMNRDARQQLRVTGALPNCSLNSNFLSDFGRPDVASAYEYERANRAKDEEPREEGIREPNLPNDGL